MVQLLHHQRLSSALANDDAEASTPYLSGRCDEPQARRTPPEFTKPSHISANASMLFFAASTTAGPVGPVGKWGVCRDDDGRFGSHKLKGDGRYNFRLGFDLHNERTGEQLGRLSDRCRLGDDSNKHEVIHRFVWHPKLSGHRSLDVDRRNQLRGVSQLSLSPQKRHTLLR